MKRKGQFVSMIAIIALLFISGGSLFTSLFAQETFSQHVNYYSNDANNIADAKMRGELYPERMENELNYTFNNVAYRIGPDGGKEKWDKNIPTISQLENELTARIWDGAYDIRRQNNIQGCTSPDIDSSTFNFDGEHNMSYTLQEPKIRCPLGNPSRAKLPITKEDTGYYIQEYKVSNKKNNYMNLAEYAINLSEKAEELTPNPMTGTGSEYTSDCQNSDSSETIEDAKDSAFDAAVADKATEAVDATSTPSYIDVNSWSTYVVSYTEETGKWEDCTYYHDHCDDVPPGVECDPGHSGHESSEYVAKYSAEVDFLHAHFEITDTENEVATYSGAENLEFDINHIYDVSALP